MRIAFDLDETLGVPIIEFDSIIGFRLRDWCIQLLDNLRHNHDLILWTVSSRQYLDKVLSFGLAKYFDETYSWDELEVNWKDIRKIRANYLIDDSAYHKEAAKKYGIENEYIVISPYGSTEDVINPFLWIKQIENVLGENHWNYSE